MPFKKIYSILLLSLVLTACGSEEVIDDSAVQVDAFEVVQESYVQEYRTNGEITAVNSAPVATRNGGVISEIKVSEGQWVEAGDELFTYTTAGSEREAEIALTTAEDTLATTLSAASSAKLSASQSVQIALQSLNSAKEEGSLSIQHAKENLSLVEDVYNETKSFSEQSIALAQQGLSLANVSYQTAKNNLENIQASTTLSLEQSQDSARQITASVDSSVQSAISLLDEILGVSDLRKYGNDSYETNLKSYSRDDFANAQESLRQVLAKNQDWYKEQNASIDYLRTYKDFISQVEEILTSTEVILANATTGSSFTDTVRTSLRSSVSSAKQMVTTARQSVQSAIHTLESSDLSQDTQLTSAQDALSSAEQSLRNAEITLEQTRTSAQQSLSSAQINLTQARNTLESTQTSVTNAIEQAELSYSNAKTSQSLTNAQQDANILSAQNNLKNLQNKYLDQLERAPISGWITDFDLKAGEYISANAVFATIVQTKSAKVEFYVPTSLSSKMRLGDQGTVLCSNGNSGVTVDFIGVTTTSAHTIKVEAILDESTTSNCHIGELTEVRILIEREPEIQVPASTFTWRTDDSIVWVITPENTLEMRKIVINQVIDNFAIVEYGLEEGELVALRPSTDFQEGDNVQITSTVAYQSNTPIDTNPEDEIEELQFGEELYKTQTTIQPTYKLSE